MSQGASLRCPAPRTSIICVAESSTASSAATPARNGSAPGRVRTASSSPRTAARSIKMEGLAEGSEDWPAAGFVSNAQLPRPSELVSSRTCTSSIVTSRIRKGRDQSETASMEILIRPARTMNGSDPQGAFATVTSEAASVGVREIDRSKEPAIFSSRPMAWPATRSMVPRSHPGTIALAAAVKAITPAVSTIAIRKRLRCLVMRRAAPSHHAIVAAEPVPGSHQGAGDAGKLSDGTRPRLMAWTSSAWSCSVWSPYASAKSAKARSSASPSPQ